MQIVTVNGEKFLGKLEVTETGVTVAEALRVQGEVKESTVYNYVEQSMLNRLESVTFGGSTLSHSSTPLNEDLEEAYAIAQRSMKRAEKNAIPSLVCQKYRGYLGN